MDIRKHEENHYEKELILHSDGSLPHRLLRLLCFLRRGREKTERVEKVEDVVSVGDEIVVKVTDIDQKGRINLSRKAVLLRR